MSGDSVDGDERKLADLGRRTVEMFTIAHIFGTKLQAAFQEEQSLRRQEELIREEEEARVAADERVQRKAEADKERRAKKKVRALTPARCRRSRGKVCTNSGPCKEQNRH